MASYKGKIALLAHPRSTVEGDNSVMRSLNCVRENDWACTVRLGRTVSLQNTWLHYKSNKLLNSCVEVPNL